jgi:hypothetical protein
VTDNEHIEQDLWTELDIDEDRDEPIFKIVVLLVTAGVVVAGIRAHCCTGYKQVPAEHDRDSELARPNWPDLPTAMRPPRLSRDSRERSDSGWSFDIFSTIATRLDL